MNVRIGSLVLSVNLLFLIFAGVYFALITWRNMYPSIIGKKSQAALALLAVSVCGVLGGLLYGQIGAGASAEPGLPPSILEFNFGSFGGYWGVLAGMALCGLIIREAPLSLMDATVPGILAGGGIARIADFFSESSEGILLENGWLHGFQPFEHWFMYDIAALLIIMLLIILRLRNTGMVGFATVYFLAGYGVLRFLIEFVRDTYHIYRWLTLGQCMAVMQIVAGLVIYFRIVNADRKHFR